MSQSRLFSFNSVLQIVFQCLKGFYASVNINVLHWATDYHYCQNELHFMITSLGSISVKGLNQFFYEDLMSFAVDIITFLYSFSKQHVQNHVHYDTVCQFTPHNIAKENKLTLDPNVVTQCIYSNNYLLLCFFHPYLNESSTCDK